MKTLKLHFLTGRWCKLSLLTVVCVFTAALRAGATPVTYDFLYLPHQYGRFTIDVQAPFGAYQAYDLHNLLTVEFAATPNEEVLRYTHLSIPLGPAVGAQLTHLPSDYGKVVWGTALEAWEDFAARNLIRVSQPTTVPEGGVPVWLLLGALLTLKAVFEVRRSPAPRL